MCDMNVFIYMCGGQSAFGWQFSSQVSFSDHTQVARLVATQILYKP